MMASVVSVLRSGLLTGCRWLASLLLMFLASALIASILMRFALGVPLSFDTPLIEVAFQWLALTALPLAIDGAMRRVRRGTSAVGWVTAAVLAAFAVFAVHGLADVEFSFASGMSSGYGVLAYPWGFGIGAIAAALAALGLRKPAQ